MIPPIVSAQWLADHPDAVIVDSRWSLDAQPAHANYVAGHIPGAVFVDLDAQLADPPSAQGGRHPLPSIDDFCTAMTSLGIANDSLVVVYDDSAGFAAGRLVWMLRILGVNAAVLDGGIHAWDGELESGEVTTSPGDPFVAEAWPESMVTTIDQACVGPVVLDARARDRYDGRFEPTGVVAGHIPGALSAPFTENLDVDGFFRSREELKERFNNLGITDANDVIVYCGSGVSACHNLIAMEAAGLGRGRLYVGSWSAYSQSGRPVATGTEPGQRPSD